MCDREEAFKALRSGPKDLNVPSSSISNLGSSYDMIGFKKEVEKVDVKVENISEIQIATHSTQMQTHTQGHLQSHSHSQCYSFPPLSQSLYRDPVLVKLDGETFGQVLELWGFLCTFAQPLKVLTIPSIPHLCNAIKACEPNFKKLKMNSRGASRSFETVSARYVRSSFCTVLSYITVLTHLVLSYCDNIFLRICLCHLLIFFLTLLLCTFVYLFRVFLFLFFVFFCFSLSSPRPSYSFLHLSTHLIFLFILIITFSLLSLNLFHLELLFLLLITFPFLTFLFSSFQSISRD